MSGPEIAGNIIQILAGLPEFLRKPMVRNRLAEFFTFPEAEKREIVTNILNAAPGIDFKVLSSLLKTWTEILCEFDEEKRRSIFAAYADVIADSPAMLRINVDELVTLFDSMPADRKQVLANSIRGLIASLPEGKRSRLLGTIPENAKRLLQL